MHTKYLNNIDIFHSRLFLFFETTSLIFLPVVVLWFVPTILQYRIQLFVAGFIYIFYLFVVEKLTFSQFGITTQNFKKSFNNLLPFTAIVFAILITSIFFEYDSRFLFIHEMTIEIQNAAQLYKALNSLIISATLQEIIFRGFYITRLELVSKNKFFLVVISSFVFAIVHAPFRNDIFTGFTFFLGIFYSLNFIKYRNIFSIIASHAILLAGLSLTILF